MRKVLERAKEQCNEDLLKKEKSSLREQAITMFKQKAVGQDISEFESQLREGISKKTREIKLEFMRHCKTKAQ